MNAAGFRRELRKLVEPGYAEKAAAFFKTGPGDYAEGDRFLGVRNPAVRGLVRRDIGDWDVSPLLHSPWHEDRLLALLVMVRRFERGGEPARRRLVKDYLAATRWINNWDLVDLSAHQILGEWLVDRDRRPLDRLACSRSLWERRIAIVSTWAFIRRGESSQTFSIATRLLSDPEDLIHKACGWMLREVGKRDVDALRGFLTLHAARMPRTMLRYSIEKLAPAERRRWLGSTPRTPGE